MVELAKGFKEKGHNVEFLIYHNINFYSNLIKEEQLRINKIVENNYLKRILKIRKFIRNGKYDVVISFLSGPCIIAELAAFPFKNWKLIVGERSANPLMMKSTKFKIYRFFHLLSDHIVTNSIENKKMIQKSNPFLSETRVSCIYNLVDLNYWNLTADYKYDENEKFKLVIPASHHQLKNLNGLVEAINLLPQKYQEKLEIHWY